MATHSSVLAWRIPGTGEPGGLSSLGSHRVGHDWSDLAAAASFSKGRMLISKVKLSFWYYMIQLLFVFWCMHFCGVCFSHALFSSEMAHTLHGVCIFHFLWSLLNSFLHEAKNPLFEVYPRDSSETWKVSSLEGWHILISQEAGMKLSISRPSRPCSCVFIWIILICIFYNTLLVINITLSWVLWVILANNQTWRGGGNS